MKIETYTFIAALTKCWNVDVAVVVCFLRVLLAPSVAVGKRFWFCEI